jgi:hypothetical protein
MPIEANYRTYDAQRAIIEKFILKDGKFAEFVKEQTLLQSTNALGGRVFNPASFAANFGDFKLTNTTVKQLLFKLGSEVLGGDFTTDGKTFARVLDTDLQKQFYDDVYRFKDDFPSDNGILKKLIRGAVNSLGQALGIQILPSRSIMAQALVYTMSEREKRIYRDRKKVDSFDGTGITSISPDVYGEAQYIQPNAKNSISYVYGNRFAVDRLQQFLLVRDEAVKGNLNSAFRVPKLQLQQEYEHNKKITTQISRRFRSFLKGAVRDVIEKVFGDAAPLIEDYINLTSKSPDSKYYYNKSEFAMAYLAKFYSHQYLRPMDETGKVTITNDGAKINELYDASISDIDRWSAEFIFEELKQDGVFIVNSSGQIVGDRAGTDVMSVNKRRLDRQRNGQAHLHSPSLQSVFGEPIASPFTNHDVLNRFGTLKVFGRTRSFQSNLEYADENKQNDSIFGSDIFDSIEEAEAYMRAERPKDRLFVLVQDLRTDKTIILHASFASINDDLSVASQPVDYFGRTEDVPSYHKTSRTLTVPLVLYAQTPRELALMYRKIDFLKSLAYPIMKDNFRQVQNPLIRISIGSVFKKVFGFLNSINMAPDSEVSWEIENGWASPKKLDLTLSLSVIHEKMPYVPSNNTFMRGADDFSMHGVEYERVLEPVSSTLQPTEGEMDETAEANAEGINSGQESQDAENTINHKEVLDPPNDTWYLVEHKASGNRVIMQGKDIGKFDVSEGVARFQRYKGGDFKGDAQLRDYKAMAKSTDRAILEAILEDMM